MRIVLSLAVVVCLALTGWPEPVSANNLLWQSQRNQMMMQQQRMQQQRMMQQQREMQRRQQEQMRRQQQAQRQRQQQLMQQRQRQMQERQRQMRLQQQRLAEQRRAQQAQRQAQIRRQQEAQRRSAQSQRAAKQTAARAQQIARTQMLQRERQLRLEQLRKRERLRKQFDKARKDSQSVGSLAMMMRQTTRTAATRSQIRQQAQQSASTLQKLRPGFRQATGTPAGKPAAMTAKQIADQKIAAFKRRQAVAGARQTKQDFEAATGARTLRPKFNEAADGLSRTFTKNAIGNTNVQNRGNYAVLDGAHALRAVDRLRTIKGPKAVLGKFPQYSNAGRLADTRRFIIRPQRFETLTATQQWRFNKRFLDRQIRDKARIVLTSPVKAAGAGSPYAREIAYLRSKGYVVSKDGLEMYKP